MNHINVAVTTAVAVCLTATAGAGLFAVSGLYNFAADEPHFPWVSATLELPQMDDPQYDQAVGSSGGHSHAGRHGAGGQDAGHGTEEHVMEGPMHSEEAQTVVQTHTHADGKVHTHTPAPSMHQGRPATAGATAPHP